MNMITKEYIEIRSVDDRDMYLTDDCLELMKKGKGLIQFKDMTDDMALFELIIMNNELTKPLYELMNLLNKSKAQTTDLSYSDMVQRFVELLVESKIDATALSGEVLINRLIRKNPDDDFNRPDFSKEDIGDYQIYTVLKALSNNKSPLIGLASQDLKKQLLSDDLVTKKTSTSYVDPFFKETTDTKSLLELYNKKMKK